MSEPTTTAIDIDNVMTAVNSALDLDADPRITRTELVAALRTVLVNAVQATDMSVEVNFDLLYTNLDERLTAAEAAVDAGRIDEIEATLLKLVEAVKLINPGVWEQVSP